MNNSNKRKLSFKDLKDIDTRHGKQPRPDNVGSPDGLDETKGCCPIAGCNPFAPHGLFDDIDASCKIVDGLLKVPKIWHHEPDTYIVPKTRLQEMRNLVGDKGNSECKFEIPEGRVSLYGYDDNSVLIEFQRIERNRDRYWSYVIPRIEVVIKGEHKIF